VGVGNCVPWFSLAATDTAEATGLLDEENRVFLIPELLEVRASHFGFGLYLDRPGLEDLGHHPEDLGFGLYIDRPGLEDLGHHPEDLGFGLYIDRPGL
jgi:hypothetical protein